MLIASTWDTLHVLKVGIFRNIYYVLKYLESKTELLSMQYLESCKSYAILLNTLGLHRAR